MPRTAILVCPAIAALLTLSPVQATDPPAFPPPEAKVLILGSFHFKDAGLDSYKPEFDIDIMSNERQEQVQEVVAALARFQPTHVAVEAKAERQAQLDERYQRYLAGDFELPSGELYQLGFRLAKVMQHKGVWAVDAPARRYTDALSARKWAAENGQRDLLEPLWDLQFDRLYRYYDKQKTEQTLRETLLERNSEENLLRNHGNYLVGPFEVGSTNGDENELYPGADATTAWYNRNLRIFANLQRLSPRKGARIVLIIGAGHVAILRHAIRASPQYEWVELSDVLSTP